MPSDSSLLERQMADVELRPFTLDEFHRRRHQKQRNRRIATSVMGLLLLAVVAGGVFRTLGKDDQIVDSDVLGPLESPFAGEWVSIDIDGSSQTMTIERTDGDAHEIIVHDESALVCADGPSTMTGSGDVESITVLVIDAKITCDDGTTPADLEETPAGLKLDVLANLTFIHDPQTDELTDSLGVLWNRKGTGPEPSSEDAGQGPNPYEGSWVTDGTESVSAASMEISLVGGDAHEIVMHGTDPTRCPDAPGSTITGTGRRETDFSIHPGLVQLVLTVELTCDDGTAPISASSDEEGLFDAFQISFVHDSTTDEMAGSLGGVWWREGAERKQGDAMATVERMFETINARDTDAYIELFAPDGSFETRGGFGTEAVLADGQAVSEVALVQTWMGVQDAWGLEADVRTCTADPSEPVRYSNASDRWIECEVASRWPKLSLEITERWRFELRGARLLYWEPVIADLDPAERTEPFGYSGLEAWEAWLAANHAEDAGRWLVAREEPPAADFADAEDPEQAAALARLTFHIEREWVIDGHSFSPAGLIPYDPAFADDIEASINEYLEEQ